MYSAKPTRPNEKNEKKGMDTQMILAIIHAAAVCRLFQ